MKTINPSSAKLYMDNEFLMEVKPYATSDIRIAVAGRLRSGKDTVIDIIHELLEHKQIERFAFGDKLKDFAHEICLDTPREPKPRELYQAMNVFRTIDSNVWIKHLNKTLSQSNVEVKLITDLRQNNEAEFCRNNGFTLIKVHTDTEIRKQRVLNAGEQWNEEFEQHPSEIEIDDMSVDYTITNNSTLEELVKQVKKVIQEIVTDYEKNKPVTNFNDTLHIYTDGACSNNQEEINTGGWGYVAVVDNTDIHKASGKAQNTSNNKMELQAVIEALSFYKSYQKDYKEIKIYTDSAYVLNGINSWIHNWIKNGWVNSKKQPVANKELWVKLHELTQQFEQLSWVKVKGHSGNKWNEVADDLATGRI